MPNHTFSRPRAAASAMLLLRKSERANAAQGARLALARSVLAFVMAAGLLGSAVNATIVRFQTSVGNIDVRLYDSITPLSVANFLNYVTSNRYDGTFIHRVPQAPTGGTSNFVVQGGGFKLNNSIFAATGIVTDAPIGNEFNVSNKRGTLAFAKNAQGATSQWFFNIGDNSFLDNQDFTVFGRVLGGGMAVVDAINNLSTVNASSAENAPGEDFDEVPVTNLQKVLMQNDIKDSDAVIVTDVIVANILAGDYDFNGTVNAADYALWKNTFGSTTNAAADGNGDGVVNAADYNVWRDSMKSSPGAGSGGIEVGGVPEPATALLLLVGGSIVALRRRLGR